MKQRGRVFGLPDPYQTNLLAGGLIAMPVGQALLQGVLVGQSQLGAQQLGQVIQAGLGRQQLLHPAGSHPGGKRESKIVKHQFPG